MKVIYTALFGDYEELKEPCVVTPGWEYHCYTDHPVKSNVWKIIPTAVPTITDNRKFARYFKIMEWVDWSQSIWVDASFIIDTNLDEWWGKYFSKGFSAPVHPLRSCVYDEILACILSKVGDREALELQKEDYLKASVPGNAGIITSGLLMRENNPNVIALCERWWAEVDKYGIRDQVAFGRVGLNQNCVHTYQWDYRREKDFIYKHHYCRR